MISLNKAEDMRKAKRATVSAKALRAIETGNVQEVIDTLTDKHKLFCQEYLKDLNATQAVIRAGYKTQFPNRVAYQLMENPAIRIAIDALKVERRIHSDITKDTVLDGIVKAIKLAEDKEKTNDMLRGYELLARHLGMFIERTEISGPDGEAIQIQKNQEQAEEFTAAIANLAKRNLKSV
jgi:phage terminase small subunit